MMNEKLIGQALDIGKKMLQSGGEVSRVEETIGLILSAYGFVRVDVFTITSEILVTAVDRGGGIHTQMRRVYRWGTNLKRLEELNRLSRLICEKRPDCGEIEERLRRLCRETEQESRLPAYAGAVLAVSGFTVFFGGSLADAAASAPLACLITYMNRRAHSRSENQLLYYFFFSVVTGIVGNLLVYAAAAAGLSLQLDKILIGCVMLTIPGLAITCSVRDMLLGDIITGLFRFVESLLIAADIAGGYIVSSMLTGGVL